MGIHVLDVNVQPGITFLLIEPSEYDVLEAQLKWYTYLARPALVLPATNDLTTLIKEIYGEYYIKNVHVNSRDDRITITIMLYFDTKFEFFRLYRGQLKDIASFLTEHRGKPVILVFK